MTESFIRWFNTFSADVMRWVVTSHPVTWTLIVGQIVIAILAILWIHRFVKSALQRLTARLPFPRRLVRYGHRSGCFLVIFYIIELILVDAPDTLLGLTMVRRLNLLGLLIIATWFGVQCVNAVADTIIELHPANAGIDPHARRIQTQTKVLAHSISALIILLGLGLAFSTLPLMRQIGATFLASAGVAGLVVGFAAKPVLGNLLAGIQLALTQAIRLGDVVVVEQEWGWIEEITGTYVVLKIWDERRLVIPLQWFIEHSFQSWTRNQTAILGTVFLWIDYLMPVEPIRKEAERLCRLAPEWNQVLCATQVTDTNEHAMQLRVLVSAGDAGACWELRCRVREGLLDFMRRDFPAFLPRVRAEIAPEGVFGKPPTR